MGTCEHTDVGPTKEHGCAEEKNSWEGEKLEEGERRKIFRFLCSGCRDVGCAPGFIVCLLPISLRFGKYDPICDEARKEVERPNCNEWKRKTAHWGVWTSKLGYLQKIRV